MTMSREDAERARAEARAQSRARDEADIRESLDKIAELHELAALSESREWLALRGVGERMIRKCQEEALETVDASPAKLGELRGVAKVWRVLLSYPGSLRREIGELEARIGAAQKRLSADAERRPNP